MFSKSKQKFGVSNKFQEKLEVCITVLTPKLAQHDIHARKSSRDDKCQFLQEESRYLFARAVAAVTNQGSSLGAMVEIQVSGCPAIMIDHVCPRTQSLCVVQTRQADQS